MTCAECRGACCEVFTLTCREATTDPVYYQWLRARATARLTGDRLLFVSPCPHLTDQGSCRIHSVKPQACRDFPVDGLECREAQALRGRP